MVSEGGERKTFALVLLCCASFVAVLDLTIVAIALPSMRRELGISGATRSGSSPDTRSPLGASCCSWAAPATLRPAAPVRVRASLVRRRLSAWGTGVGALGACGCAPIAGGWWSGARTGLALVATIFAEGEERNRAMGAYGAMAGVGFVFGMVLGV